jgi:chitinase
MNLFYVTTSAFGSYGSVVVCETANRAKEMFLKEYPYNQNYRIYVKHLTDLTKEYIQPEIMSGGTDGKEYSKSTALDIE